MGIGPDETGENTMRPGQLEAGRFLAGVAAVIRTPGGAYLLMRRAADRDFGAGVWECVTGRVQQGESFEQALHREVYEETGLRVAVDFIVALTHFHRGTKTPNTELQGVTFCCSTTAEATLMLNSEHDAYRWLTATEALALLDADDSSTRWMRATLLRAESMSALVSQQLAAIHRRGVTVH
jgi:8-oxo-dGTP diphosphatase